MADEYPIRQVRLAFLRGEYWSRNNVYLPNAGAPVPRTSLTGTQLFLRR
jgi:hypothetical protein